MTHLFIHNGKPLLQGMWTIVLGESGTNYHCGHKFGHKSVSFTKDTIPKVINKMYTEERFSMKIKAINLLLFVLGTLVTYLSLIFFRLVIVWW